MQRAELHVLGRVAGASNTTLLTRLDAAGTGPLAIYKPISGERPLWDFPDGSLAGRERAAYVISELGGWQVVPRTILRDGPLGRGMVQEWLGGLGDDAPESVVHVIRPGSLATGLIPVLRAVDDDGGPLLVAHEDAPDVRALAVLDVVLNNTDRKGAHAFRHEGRLYAVDHGVTFHREPKLRTVLWGWAGEALPDSEIYRLETLASRLERVDEESSELAEHLTVREVRARRARVAALLAERHHPAPAGEWPAIPWPPL